MTNEKIEEKKLKVSMDLLKKLREQTQLGYTECQKALLQAKNDEEKALLILKSKSLILAGKRFDRKLSEGTIASYMHKSLREAVLLQLGCETSFVANLPDFALVAQKLASAIYQYKPKYLYFEDIPSYLWQEKFNFFFKKVKEENMNLSLNEYEELSLNEVQKFFAEEVLVAQNLDNTNLSIEDYIGSQMGLFKENIKILRFIIFRI